ncbi:ankyrin repeat domain-containing protein [Actinopolymorpha sp. B11F2]|uniref:globin domain-containing protein n=1 Tax=Actinopolymorpha sp. B11F2 TaxID=3160862 RepID=UPI0032E3FD2E
MPKKQTTAGRKARAATREGEKYTTALRAHLERGGDPSVESYVPGATPPSHPALAHRSLLDHPPGFRPFRGTDLFDRIGGQPAIDRLVDLLYDGFDGDEHLRPLFPRDLADGRSMQKLFFAEWLGGPRRYSEQSHAGLRHRHDSLPITSALAGRWLGHFRRAMEATIAAEDDRSAIFAQVRSLALALVNDQVAPARPAGPAGRGVGRDGQGAGGEATSGAAREVAWCGSGGRTVKRARDLARRGDVAGVDAALVEAPDLLRPTYAAAIMQAASLTGRTEVVRTLLDRGVGADHPYYLPVGVTGVAFERVLFVTPLCAARMKRRSAVETLLTAAGAREDVFTAAFLGDLSSLTRMLAADPDLAQATDPAVDVLDITPVDHAVAGGWIEALRLLLGHAPRPRPDGVRALRAAAAMGNVAMVELLLAYGADATRIGVGRWVLHPEIAPLLAGRGASIDSSGSWIGSSCTGNQGRKDDPEYVRALLRHGARADDRRTSDSGSTSGVGALNATALHYATKAGFLNTIEVLLEHGADPYARDSHGRTPLDWLEKAAPSVPQATVRRLLTSGRRRR